MGRKRKNRTHLKDPNASSVVKEGAPKSFIIKHGQVGRSLSQLVRDVRKVMEPNTASRLRERSKNKLKDYLTMAPALKVTHLLAFTLTPIAPSLRIVRLSAGPTLSFRVERYSLMKDLLSSKKARNVGMEYLSPPLLVLASFPPVTPSTPPHIPLLIKTFQSLFPSLSPQTLSISSARRVVLVSYNAERGGTIDIRHYLITIKAYGVSKRVRRILSNNPSTSKKSSGFIDLGNEKDVADFLLRKRGMPGPASEGGYESAASSEDEGAEDAISLPGDYPGRNNRKGSKRAVRLDEVGPRMELRLIKITEGVPGKQGEVLFHEFVKKSKAEVKKQREEFKAKELLRKQRREEQEQNVQRKKQGAAAADGTEDDDDDGTEEGDDENGNDEGENDDEGDWDEEEDIHESEEEEDTEDEEAWSTDGEPEDILPLSKKAKRREKQ